MTQSPANPENEIDDDDVDFEIDLDDLDDAALQRLLEEDPALEEELRALEAEDADVIGEASVGSSVMVPPIDTEDSIDAEIDEDEPELAHEQPTHDDLAEYQPDHDDAFGNDEETSISSEEYEALVSDETMSDVRPVPRINIHCFCQSEHVSNLVEKASGDRRLAKVHLSVHSGDAQRAAEIYASDTTPNLIIIEAGSSAIELLKGLDSLAQVCDPSTRVIVIGTVNDITLYRELMDRGISEYIVRPHSPLQIISTIGNLYADPSAPPIGKTYVFVGARGGAGSSSVCHNVAWNLAERFKSDTILVDLDLAFGTAGLDFEHDPSQGLAEALAAPERLDDVLLDRLLQKATDRLSLFVAPNALERDYDLPSESYEAVVDIIRQSAPSIVIDLPHVWSSWARQILQSADEIVLTATPDLASFRNSKNIAEIINGYRANDAPPVLVLNQVGVPKRPEVPADQFEEALELKVRASLPWDPVLFGNCATNAQPMLEVAPKSKSIQEIDKIANLLLGQANVQNSSSKFSLKSLFGK